MELTKQTRAVSKSGETSTLVSGLPLLISRRIRGIVLAIGLTLCGSTVALAQADGTWGIVDDVLNGSSQGIAIDANGNVFVCGSLTDSSGASHALVLKSSDHGQTWGNDPITGVEQVSDDYQSSDGSATWYSAIATYGEGNVIATGRGNGKHWIVRRSLDFGATWASLTDALDCSSFYAFKPNGIAVDSDGRIYIVGWAETQVITRKSTSMLYHWIVVRSTDAGRSWQTIKKIDSSSYNNNAYGVVCIGTDVFVAGRLNDHWEVQRYDGGSLNPTWMTVDHFQVEAGYAAAAFGITVDPSSDPSQPNSLIVVGTGSRKGTQRSGDPSNWMVRRGTGIGTNSFQTIDVFANAQSFGASATVDRFGNVHVTGSAKGDNNLIRWFTRQSVSRGPNSSDWAWKTTDQFYQSTVRASQGWDVAADANGNVFVAGTSYSDADQVDHRWIIRRNPRVLPSSMP